MSKKKSYMNINNILSEGLFGDFFKGLFRGKKALDRDVAKAKIKLQKNVDKSNDSLGRLEKAILKQYGKKVKFKKQDMDDFLDRAKL